MNYFCDEIDSGKPRRAFVFSYPNLNLGGIQISLFNTIRALIAEGVDVYWLAPKQPYVDPGFYETIEGIHVVDRTRCVSFLSELSSKYAIVALAVFSFEECERMCQLLMKMNAQKHSIKIVYMMPHFDNPELYPEQVSARDSVKSALYSYARERYMTYLENDTVFFFRKKHAEALASHYDINVDPIASRLIGNAKRSKPLDENALRLRARRKKFRIVAVSRWDFPHKSYLLGLVEAFSEIRKIREDASLLLVGWGDGEDELRRCIERVNEEDRAFIEMIPGAPYGGLDELYGKAELSVALAGSVLDSAEFGVPTLVARHYCRNCEVYGFASNCFDKRLSTEPGESLIEYVKRIAEMSEDTYVKLAKEAYETTKAYYEDTYNPTWMFGRGQSNPLGGDDGIVSRIHYLGCIRINAERIKLIFRSPKAFFSKLLRRLGVEAKSRNRV